jgi:hypothetical protein
VPGVRGEVHRQKAYDLVSPEKSIGNNKKDLVVAGIGGRCVRIGGSIWGTRKSTIRTWLCRSGMQGKKLHERFVTELELIHVQLDELWANVKNGNQDI